MRARFLSAAAALALAALPPAAARAEAPAEAPAKAGALTLSRLRCESLVNPLGIDIPRPRLSWEPASDRRAERQTAYRVLVASDAERLKTDAGDLWDSGKVESDQSIHVVYAGKALASAQRAFWKVRVWDRDGRPSAWSEPAGWEMGLLRAEDWTGKWIGTPGPAGKESAPLFRKAFALSKPVRSARAYVCGLGYHELYLNGKKAGDHVLDPAFTRYDRRALYVTHDVTALLHPGKNAAGVMLGNGWYNSFVKDAWDFPKAPWRNPPRFLLQLRVEYADGTTESIASDETWKTAPGPIVYDCIRNGETYDARRERPKWAEAEGSEDGWTPAQPVDPPGGALRAQMLPPIKVMKTLAPVKITEPKPGVHVFDLGQNIAGWAQLKVSGPAGTKVVMRYGERLHPDGTLDQKAIAEHVKEGVFQTDTYILKGGGAETWEPRFVYHGFQYVEVAGFPGKPAKDTLRGRVVHTSFEPAGTFECSNPLLNRIEQLTLWSFVGNFHGYPTDCPHREKNGWTGDGHISAEQAMYQFDNAAAYTKWMDDFKDEQRESGELPGIVPTSGWGYAWGNGPAWDSAYLLVPWYLYLYAGDTRILEEHFDRHKRYVDYLTAKAKDGIVSIGLGDWVPVKDETPVAVTSTGYYYRDATIVAEAARLLGKKEDAEKYAALAAEIRKAFRAKFVDAATGRVANGTQTALSCAVYQGLIDPEEMPKAAEALAANVERNRGHLNCGMLGSKYLLHALTDLGRTDLAYTIATRKDYPSWGGWIEQGATTLWEDWKGGASRNHIFLGDITAWFYQALAGINADPAAPGFKHIVIRPHVAGDLTWAKAETHSVRGVIASRWAKEGGAFKLELTIPANTTATVYLPATDESKVTEGGGPASKAEGVTFLRKEGDRLVYEVGSGRYQFGVR